MIRFSKYPALALALLWLASPLEASPWLIQDEKKEEASGPSIVLENATIHSMSAEGTFVGSIVVTDGKIAAIGEKVESPEDAQTYDLKGFHVTPGLIESRGKLWLTTQALAESNSRAELKVVDAIDPWNEDGENWPLRESLPFTFSPIQPVPSAAWALYCVLVRTDRLRTSS